MRFDSLTSTIAICESFGFVGGLTESIKVADNIKKILNDHGLDIPDGVDDVDSVDMNPKDINTLNVSTRGKTQAMRIGKVLQRLFPDKLNTVEVNQIAADILEPCHYH